VDGASAIVVAKQVPRPPATFGWFGRRIYCFLKRRLHRHWSL